LFQKFEAGKFSDYICATTTIPRTKWLTAAQIAGQLDVSRRRFFDWMNALKAGGLAGLLERQHGGGAVPQCKATRSKEFGEFFALCLTRIFCSIKK
jgi:hypothetical protein